MTHRARWTLAVALLIALGAPLAAVRAQGDEPHPIPTDYADIADDYTALETEAETLGSGAIDLFFAQDFEALHSQFSNQLAETITLEAIEQGYTQLTSMAPIGDLIAARVLPLGSRLIYVADYDWNDEVLTVVTAFDDSGAIDALSIAPSPILPDDPALDYTSEATFRLPLDGLWYAVWGGPDRLHNYHVDAEPQRHAYDFLVWQGGSTFSGDGIVNEDYYAYGQPVVAPTEGTVVRVVNDLPENAPQVETDTAHPAGNHVVIQTAEAEYLYLAHMQPGSIVVAEGDTVEAGDPIGLVGNSGNTTEPHLHIHLQDQLEMFVTDANGTITGISDALGLPLAFSNVVVNGEPVEQAMPLGGTFVQNGE